jgi:hypothetical protein
VRELVVYVDVATNESESPEALAQRARTLPGVTSVDSQVEQAERSLGPAEMITSVTLVLTSAAGAAGAAALLLDKLKELVKSARGVRNAWVQTPNGPKPVAEVTPADLGG